jgi:hypothetical protein
LLLQAGAMFGWELFSKTERNQTTLTAEEDVEAHLSA